MYVALESDWALGVFQAVAKLEDMEAEIVVKDSCDLRELEGEGDADLVTIYNDLIVRMMGVLAHLGLVGEVHFVIMDQPSDKEVYTAMKSALANVPECVVLTPEFCEEIGRHAMEEKEQAKAFLERLRKDMQEEGLRRGLNKEERENMTLGEYMDWETTEGEHEK